MKIITLLWVVLVAFGTAESQAKSRKPKKPAYRIELTPHPDKAKVLAPLPSGKFSVVEKEFEAKSYCNEAALSNPDEIEVFLINRRSDRVLVLCPGSLDGEKNVATLFYPNHDPLRKDLAPAKTSARVTDRQLQDAFGKAINTITDSN